MDFADDVLMHLCGTRDWSSAEQRRELGPGPGADFVHLSTPAQVHLPANRLYRGRSDLVLLHIDPARLDSPLRWEPGIETDPDGMLFPHLYGPIPAAAVVGVTPYLPGPDGVFSPLA